MSFGHAPHTENGDKVNLINLSSGGHRASMRNGVYGTLAVDEASWWTLSQLLFPREIRRFPRL